MENILKNEFLKLSKQEQKTALEVILFASDTPLSEKELSIIFNINTQVISGNQNNQIDEDEDTNSNFFDFQSLINEINIDLNNTGRPFQIIMNAGGYLFSSKPEYGELLQSISKYKIKKRLSQAALETLSIIAYKQPISKPEIEQIRGINSNEIVNSLSEKGLIEIIGRRDIIGKPLIYGTTNNFLKIFGINSLEDLPKLREIDEILEEQGKSTDNTITLNIDGFDETNDKNSQFEIPPFNDYSEKNETNILEAKNDNI